MCRIGQGDWPAEECCTIQHGIEQMGGLGRNVAGTEVKTVLRPSTRDWWHLMLLLGQ